MWYEILPSLGLVVVFVAIPPYASKVINYFTQNGKVCMMFSAWFWWFCRFDSSGSSVMIKKSKSHKCQWQLQKIWHNPELAPAPMGLPMLKHWQLTWPCCSFRQQRRGLFHDIAQIFRFTIIREIHGHSGNPAKSPHYECKPAEKALEISVQSSYSFALLAMLTSVCKIFSVVLHLTAVPLLVYNVLIVRLQIYKLRMTHFGLRK